MNALSSTPTEKGYSIDEIKPGLYELRFDRPFARTEMTEFLELLAVEAPNWRVVDAVVPQ